MTVDQPPQTLDQFACAAAVVRSGVGSLTWQLDTFAYAESFDEGPDAIRGYAVGNWSTVERTVRA